MVSLAPGVAASDIIFLFSLVLIPYCFLAPFPNLLSKFWVGKEPDNQDRNISKIKINRFKEKAWWSFLVMKVFGHFDILGI